MTTLTEALAVISDNIKSLFGEVTARKFITTIIILIVFALLSILVLNYFTGYLFFKRINQKISAIERIELKSDNNNYVNMLDSAYFSMLSELNDFKTKKTWHLDTNSPKYERIMRILFSLILPVFILLVSKRNTDFRNLFIGLLIFSIIFGFTAALIPTIYKLWLTAIIIILGELIFLFVLVRLQKK